jgi:mRNA interferase MazF
MAFNSRDVVLVPFPYRDRLAEKTRPAVVLSGASYNARGDLVIAAVTSQPARFPTDYELIDWQVSGLPQASTVRMLIATVADARVVYTVGRLTDRDWSEVQARLHLVFS